MYQQEGVCFYPGKFNPPTKYHLTNAMWLQSQRSVGQVVIVLGEDVSGEISQENKQKIFSFYEKTQSTGMISYKSAKESEGGPYRVLYEFLSKTPEIRCYIALDSETAQSPKINTLFGEFKNAEYIILPSSHDDSSERMLKYAEEDNIKGFTKLLPNNLGQSQINQILELIVPKQEEPQQDVKETYTRMFNDGFWKNIIQ